ncbi:hypothetical protein D3C72_59870 [compost metagenome]
MSRFIRLGAATGVLISVFCPPIQAAPLVNRGSLMGVPPYSQGMEVEFGLADTVQLGGQFLYLWGGRSTIPWTPFTPHAGGRQQWSAWLHYGHRLAEDASVGLIGGMHQSWEEGESLPASVIRHESAGLVGVTYERSWEALRLRLRPTLLVIPQDWMGIPWYGVLAKSAVLSGIPWVEVGFRVAPHAELSVRASSTPLALTLTF